MNELVLVRHGQSLWNKENRFTGWVDVDLSEQGLGEAHSAGTLLREQGFDFDMVPEFHRPTMPHVDPHVKVKVEVQLGTVLITSNETKIRPPRFFFVLISFITFFLTSNHPF